MSILILRNAQPNSRSGRPRRRPDGWIQTRIFRRAGGLLLPWTAHLCFFLSHLMQHHEDWLQMNICAWWPTPIFYPIPNHLLFFISSITDRENFFIRFSAFLLRPTPTHFFFSLFFPRPKISTESGNDFFKVGLQKNLAGDYWSWPNCFLFFLWPIPICSFQFPPALFQLCKNIPFLHSVT